MKNKLLILFLIINSALLAAQSKAVMEIDYETKITPDSLNKNNQIITASTLYCNNVESVYYSKDAKNFYDILYKNKGGKTYSITNMAGMPRFPKERGSITKKDNKIIATLPIAKDIYEFEEPDLKWEILNDTKDIKGFKSRLAKTITDTGETFFAWFTEDISIQEGPFRFKGLAGMILEVYNKNKTIEIYATEIKKTDATIDPIYYGKAIKLPSKSLFLKTRKNYYEDPSGFIGNTVIVTDMNGNNLNKKIDENIKKTNVFLD